MKKNKKIVFIMSVLLICLLTGCRKTEIDLNKYVSFESTGYDTMGTASYTFDKDAFLADYEEVIKLSDKNRQEVKKDAKKEDKKMKGSAAEILLDVYIDGELDVTSDLSNGDTVNFKWNCDDEDVLQYFNVSLQYSDVTFDIDNLSPIEEFNPFDYVTVSFSGTEPYGNMSIDIDDSIEEMNYITITTEESIYLNMGDEVKLTASLDCDDEEFLETFGERLGQTEEIYTVDGLSYYVRDISDIPEDIIDKMYQQATDEFNAAAANDGYYKRSTIDSYEIYGYYFLNRKEDDPNNINYGKYNIYNCVFKVDLTTEAGVSGSFFYVMRFYNIMILEDGSCSVDLQVNERDGYAMEIGKEWFLGYDTVESMFSDCVTANIDKYEYTTNIEK